MPDVQLGFAALSDPGRVRRGNEDAYAVIPEHGVFVVCDGVGGAAGGEIASQLAADTFVQKVAERLTGILEGQPETPARHEADLRDGVKSANDAVHSRSQTQPELFGMATTMVGMLFVPAPARGPGSEIGETETEAGTIWLANVGDSLCYRFREGRLEQLTHDHSLVSEQVRSGLMTQEQAEISPMRNVITRAIGSDRGVEADVQNLRARHGDIYLLASDGLTRDLSNSDVAGVLSSGPGFADGTEQPDLAVVCAELVRLANKVGGADNITCLLVWIP